MKVLLILAMSIVLFGPQRANGQNNALWAGFGLQSSRMDDMKYLQELILETYPIEGRISSSFPTYTMGSFGYVNQWYPNIRIGAGYSHTASGGKSSYSDYSGYITTAMNASSHRVGAYASYLIIGGDWYELSLLGRLEINYTLIDITSTFYAMRQSNYQNNKYSSMSPGGSAGLEIMVHIRNFSLGVEGGYDVNIPGQLTSRDSKNELLDPNDRNRVLTSDWTGWFSQLKVLLWLNN